MSAYIPNAIAAEMHIYPGGSIQEAINVSSNWGCNHCTPGTYVENIDFLGKATTVRSTNPNDLEIVHSTIINVNSFGSAVIFSNEEGTNSILSGITVGNGRAKYETDYPVFVDGGIYCSFSSPTNDKYWFLDINKKIAIIKSEVNVLLKLYSYGFEYSG
ncbi:MAG: hypothetical protein ACMUIU_18415 [bacterium]